MNGLVPRRCTPVPAGGGAEARDEGGGPRDDRSRPLEEYRNAPAYVLLGDPGAGKSTAFERECKALGDARACLIPARDFLTLDLAAHPEWRGKTLFIDGLDEVRAGATDPRTPFDGIRARLDRLARPRFRLSCRAADWIGANDSERLRSVCPDNRVEVLRLDPLNDAEAEQILRGQGTVRNAAAFLAAARKRGVGGLLANPQSLLLLARAVSGSGRAWPQSRTEVFARACRQMAIEWNPEHAAAIPRERQCDPQGLVDAAGRLCSLLLLSGAGECSAHPGDTGGDAIPLRQCASGEEEILRRAIATGLFRSPAVGRYTPVHRHIAEYLAARHLAGLIDDGDLRRSLPAARVLALITGGDGQVVSAFRGLSGWLAALSARARPALIDRDPVGVALYGDTTGFSSAHRRRLLASLHGAAPELASLSWSATAPGQLVTPDLEPDLRQILADRSREREHQALVAFVLRITTRSAPLPGLSDLMLGMARDASWQPDVNRLALDAFLHADAGRDETAVASSALLEDVRAGAVEDPDDELRGTLLARLFPHRLPAARIWDYLHDDVDRRLGRYCLFWRARLVDSATEADVATLLDALVARGDVFQRLRGSSFLRGLPLKLLARGVDLHGDHLDRRRLYDWLGLGASVAVEGAFGDENEPLQRVRAWLSARPEVQKSVVSEELRRLTDPASEASEAPDAESRLLGAAPPPDLGVWCLERALLESDQHKAAYLLRRAVRALGERVGDRGLSVELLRERTRDHDALRRQLSGLLSSPLDPSRVERRRVRAERDAARRRRWAECVRTHEEALRENRCPPPLLRQLAGAYFGAVIEATGADPHARIGQVLESDAGLVDSVLMGLCGAPARSDVPALDDIVRRAAQGQEYHLALPVLAGMAELHAMDPGHVLALDEPPLRSALAFHFLTPTGDEPAWQSRLVESRPDLVSEVLIRCAAAELRRGQAYVSGLPDLASRDGHSAVARRAALPLLRSFPARCTRRQITDLDHLLLAALRHADRASLRKLLESRLALSSLNVAQRVHWLSAGMVAEPAKWRGPFEEFVADGEARVRQVAVFCSSAGLRSSLIQALSAPDLALLFSLLGRSFRPAAANALVTLAADATECLGLLIRELAARPGADASAALEGLSSDPRLVAWHDPLARARDRQRVVRRDASYRHPDLCQIRRTLQNGTPANAADLAALIEMRLAEIAGEIRNANTDDWKQYWNLDCYGRPVPGAGGGGETAAVSASPGRPENACRDALLSRLRDRLPPAVDAQPEGEYADDQRADVRVACGDFNVPVEVKKSSHRDLWSAIRRQLMARYTTDPATGGYGIYLVFWFGADSVAPPPDGRRPRSADELEERLTASLSAAEARRISVCVVDVSERRERDTRDPSAPPVRASPAVT